jgi:hypothetical protein
LIVLPSRQDERGTGGGADPLSSALPVGGRSSGAARILACLQITPLQGAGDPVLCMCSLVACNARPVRRAWQVRVSLSHRCESSCVCMAGLPSVSQGCLLWTPCVPAKGRPVRPPAVSHTEQVSSFSMIPNSICYNLCRDCIKICIIRYFLRNLCLPRTLVAGYRQDGYSQLQSPQRYVTCAIPLQRKGMRTAKKRLHLRQAHSVQPEQVCLPTQWRMQHQQDCSGWEKHTGLQQIRHARRAHVLNVQEATHKQAPHPLLSSNSQQPGQGVLCTRAAEKMIRSEVQSCPCGQRDLQDVEPCIVQRWQRMDLSTPCGVAQEHQAGYPYTLSYHTFVSAPGSAEVCASIQCGMSLKDSVALPGGQCLASLICTGRGMYDLRRAVGCAETIRARITPSPESQTRGKSPGKTALLSHASSIIDLSRHDGQLSNNS